MDQQVEVPVDEELVKQLEEIVDNTDDGLEPTPEPQVGTITVPRQVIDIISQAPSGQRILQTCIDLATFLASKNIAYGDSALNPTRAFSKASPTEQLLVRIDDKINRLVKGDDSQGDDDILDLTGYLILYLTARENDAATSSKE